MIDEACRMLDQLLLAGLRRDHPGEDEETLALRAAHLEYGSPLMEQLTGRALPP